MMIGGAAASSTCCLLTSALPRKCDKFMIRKSWNNDKWLLTSQVEHARLSAIMAASWKFPDGKPPEEVFKAILGHDDGWKDMDAAPQVTRTGQPRDFMEMRFSDSAEIFEKSISARREAAQPYAAALVTGHFLSLAETADLSRSSIEDARSVGRFIARMRDLLKQLHAEIGQGENGEALLARFEADLRFLRVCDYLSLLLCSDFTGEETLEDVPYLEEGSTLRVSRSNSKLALSLAPLPFKKNLRDHLTSWILPDIPYETDEELASALQEVKTTTNEVHLGAG